MKFFTPELYERFGSQDDDIADAADADWEKACARYRKHLKKVLPQLPEALQKFVQTHNLHDAEVIGPARLSMFTIPWGNNDVVLVTNNRNTILPEQADTIMFLQYRATVEPVVTIPYPSPSFHQGQTHWLYDEIDVVSPGVFSHDILLSDGRVVHLEFLEFKYLLTPVFSMKQTQAQGQEKKKTTTRQPKAASA